MRSVSYLQVFQQVLEDEKTERFFQEALALLEKGPGRIFFIGNGGSQAICSHMMEDFAKIGRFPTSSFSDPSLISCFANDYGYEEAMKEWLRIECDKNDLLVAISSSGTSKNILNGVEMARKNGARIIALSGFEEGNPLSQKGDLSLHVPSKEFGIVECLHQTVLHILLDRYAGQDQ